MDFGNLINNLLDQMAFSHLRVGSYVIILVTSVFLYLAIRKEFEPLLLISTAFGMLLANIYPETMYSPEETSNDTGGLLWYFLQPDEQGILPSLIFPGVGTMTDLGPLTADPIGFLMSIVAQLNTYSTYFLVILLGLLDKGSATISITGGAGGSAPLFLCSELGQTRTIGPTTVAAYPYMVLVPITQPPFMKSLTTKKECKIRMEQLRSVSRLKRILFPIIVTVVVCLILSSTIPLVGILMLGNLFRESGVVKQLTGMVSNALTYTVVIPLGVSVGTTTSIGVFLNVITIKIVALGPTVFIFGTIGDILLGELLCKLTGGKINPLIGSAGAFATPTAACISQKVGAEADPISFLLTHAMRPNIAGVIGIAAAVGTFVVTFGVQRQYILITTAVMRGGYETCRNGGGLYHT